MVGAAVFSITGWPKRNHWDIGFGTELGVRDNFNANEAQPKR